MKKFIMKFASVLLIICLTTTSVFAANTSSSGTSLTAKEKKYLQQRGFNSSEIGALSQTELDAMLGDFRDTITLFSAPTNYVRVTNIPTQGIEYFHPSTNQTNGDYYDQTNYLYMDWGPRVFSSTIFGESIPQDKYMYYLWGEWDDTAKTHQGVDVKYTMASSTSVKNVKSAHEGKITYLDRTRYGVVAIYDGNYTHYYLHLKNIPNNFSVGTSITLNQRIGDQGAVGLSNANYYHVHYEVRSGKQTNGPRGTSGLNTIEPYYIMASQSMRSKNK